jgi:hypothetical protein
VDGTRHNATRAAPVMPFALAAPAATPVVAARGRRRAERPRDRSVASISTRAFRASAIIVVDDVTRRESILSSAALLLALGGASPQRALAAEPIKSSFYDYTVMQYGKPFALSAFANDVTVVLNVASE